MEQISVLCFIYSSCNINLVQQQNSKQNCCLSLFSFFGNCFSIDIGMISNYCTSIFGFIFSFFVCIKAGYVSLKLQNADVENHMKNKQCLIFYHQCCLTCWLFLECLVLIFRDVNASKHQNIPDLVKNVSGAK